VYLIKLLCEDVNESRLINVKAHLGNRELAVGLCIKHYIVLRVLKVFPFSHLLLFYSLLLCVLMVNVKYLVKSVLVTFWVVVL